MRQNQQQFQQRGFTTYIQTRKYEIRGMYMWCLCIHWKHATVNTHNNCAINSARFHNRADFVENAVFCISFFWVRNMLDSFIGIICSYSSFLENAILISMSMMKTIWRWDCQNVKRKNREREGEPANRMRMAHKTKLHWIECNIDVWPPKQRTQRKHTK